MPRIAGAVSLSPPRTRGSTHINRISRRRVWVSPAHAGIDPEDKIMPRVGPRLPRARGDRPHVPVWAGVVMRSPPRTRGSTLFCVVLWRAMCVSPADAGIDLYGRGFQTLRICLPRARGDRPTPEAQALAADLSPPRTRGSTLVMRHGSRPLLVSPAHAGIDLATHQALIYCASLPRARGDRPYCGHRQSVRL